VKFFLITIIIATTAAKQYWEGMNIIPQAKIDISRLKLISSSSTGSSTIAAADAGA